MSFLKKQQSIRHAGLDPASRNPRDENWIPANNMPE